MLYLSNIRVTCIFEVLSLLCCLYWIGFYVGGVPVELSIFERYICRIEYAFL